MIEAASLESAILGGYVDHVRKLRPGAPLPVVYRDEGLLADARDLRAQLGDEKFIAGLPGDQDDEWGEPWKRGQPGRGAGRSARQLRAQAPGR